ncbi:MAG TPA: NAD(P)H-dependent oxidoreductase subunit E [Candidatus Eremiobacteraceae bacterium]|nr:NAD(P)H-dependent oxidoreductase subunit E [Candidatus Eremiobacteraceae bacterium]
MDIHLTEARASAEEKAAIDAVLGAPTGRWDGGDRSRASDDHLAEGAGHVARERRHLLLPALHAANDRIGWISEGALNYICERLTIPPAEAYGVASFYHMFSLKPRPKNVVFVCDDIACMCAYADQLCDELTQQVGPEGEPARAGTQVWLRSPCLGLCDSAPAALYKHSGERQIEEPLPFAAPSLVRRALDEASLGGHGSIYLTDDDARLLTHDGHSVRPEMIEQVRERLGKVPAHMLRHMRRQDHAALRRALALPPSNIIEEVKKSKLMGRGGAAFPTGRKWEAVANEPERPHYLVCNADESEPGTFKDLRLMEWRHESLIEAMTIAGYAGGCTKGYIYVRWEYPNAKRQLWFAIHRARQAGALGENIFGSGFNFDIEIRRGAGAYICGEETALFNSIEGYRGEPRNKPPFPVQQGLFGKPTIVNNVETLINIPDIILEGGEAYAKIGTNESTGTKLFCLSGCVAKPDVYEVPFGTTLRALIDKAGGVRGGRTLQAVLLGGAAGTFLTPDEIDVPLSFEGVRAIKATLGSGVVMLFDDRIDLRKIVARIARFFREESCGQCVPCRVGTVRQEELLERLASGASNGKTHAERALLGEIGQAMRDASICGLGQTASSAVESAIVKFDLFGTKAG